MRQKIQLLQQKLAASPMILNTAKGYALRMAGIALSFIFTKTIIYYFGIEAWGRFSLSFTYLFLLTVLTKAGFDMALMRYASEWHNKDMGAVNSVYRQCMKFVLPTGILLSMTLLLGAEPLAIWLKKPEIVNDFRWAAVAVIPFALTIIHSEGLRGLNQISFYNFAQTVGNFLVTLLILPVAYFLLGDALQPVSIFVIGVIIISSLTAWQWHKSTSNTSISTQKFRFEEVRAVAVPMFLSNIIFVAMGYLDTFILGFYCPEYEIGIYNVSAKLSNILTIPLFAVSGFLAPKITAFHAENDSKGLQHLLLQSSKIVAATIIPLFIFIAIFPEFLLGLFNINDENGTQILVVIALGYCFNALSGATDITLQMTGHEKIFRNIVLVAIALNLVLNFIFIPMYGSLGAAYANVFTIIFWNVLSIIYSHKKTGVQTSFVLYYLNIKK
jgi:O-antigen/teichoic acid export membrane protein